MRREETKESKQESSITGGFVPLPMEVAISFFASSEPHPFRVVSNRFKKPGRNGGR